MSWIRRIDFSAALELAVLAGVLAIAAVVSYTHLRDVWIAAGAPWADLGPLLVDGLFASAWLRMRRRRRQGEAVGLLAWAALALALVATLAGNIAAAIVSGHDSWLSLVVAAWPAVAFALVWELVTGHGRGNSSHPEILAPAGDDQETFDERAARLIESGLGRQQLARELGITEWSARGLIEAHQKALA